MKSLPRLSLVLAICTATPLHAAPDWKLPSSERAQRAEPGSTGAIVRSSRPVEQNSRWVQVPGCARAIAAGGANIVYVAGCEVPPGSYGASAIYRWNGQAFAPHPAGGAASALASFGGSSYAIGGDAMLYSSHADGSWQQRGTPEGRTLTALAAGIAGLWVITSDPNGEGGNAVARAMPCRPQPGQLVGKDFCGWEAVPGAAVKIAVGRSVWVVAHGGAIFEWNAVQSAWARRPGCFTDVAANGQEVFAVSCQRGQGDGRGIFRWNNGGWVDWQGAGRAVAVDAAGNPWVVTDSGQIWRQQNPNAGSVLR